MHTTSFFSTLQGPGEIFKLIKPLYSLVDSGDRWHSVMRDHHLKDLDRKNTTGDRSLYCKYIAGRLVGLSGVYVDVTIRTGNQYFQEMTKRAGKRFDARKRTYEILKFMSMVIEQPDKSPTAYLSMKEYIA
eukprot:IDg2743t1